MEYMLFDTLINYGALFRGPSLDDTCHELLIHLNNHLSFIININAKVTTFNFDNYTIRQVTHLPTKPHPIVYNEYVLNTDLILSSATGNINLMELVHTRFLAKQIKLKMDQLVLVKKQKQFKKTKSDRQQLNELIVKTKKLTDNVLYEQDIPDELELTEEEEEDSEPDVDSESSPINDQYAEQIKEQFMLMKQVRNNEKASLKEIKEDAKKIEKEVVNERCEYDATKMDIRRLKEKEIEKSRVFEHDKNVTYVRIKQSIEENSLTEENIPPMFAQRYPIFKFMETENLLNVDGDYETYCTLYDEMYPPKKEEPPQEYVPHNVHYLSEDQNKDIVEPKAIIKSLDEIFKETENSDEEIDETSTFE
jgi:hypothetical protein